MLDSKYCFSFVLPLAKQLGFHSNTGFLLFLLLAASFQRDDLHRKNTHNACAKAADWTQLLDRREKRTITSNQRLSHRHYMHVSVYHYCFKDHQSEIITLGSDPMVIELPHKKPFSSHFLKTSRIFIFPQI